MGIVTEVFQGSDGVIRSVKVKTSKGVITRSIQKLHDLKINAIIYKNQCHNVKSPNATGISNIEILP